LLFFDDGKGITLHLTLRFIKWENSSTLRVSRRENSRQIRKLFNPEVIKLDNLIYSVIRISSLITSGLSISVENKIKIYHISYIISYPIYILIKLTYVNRLDNLIYSVIRISSLITSGSSIRVENKFIIYHISYHIISYIYPISYPKSYH
jgi:hypothetical protein